MTMTHERAVEILGTKTGPRLASERTGWSERWKRLPGFGDRYEVSDLGRVRSWTGYGGPAPRLLTPTPDTGGYLQVSLRHDGRGFTKKVHRLVLLTFVGPPPEGQEARHLNGDQRDNRLSNLAYGSHSENVTESVAHGTHTQGRKTHCRNNHPYDSANTRITGEGYRECRTCRANQRRARRTAP